MLANRKMSLLVMPVVLLVALFLRAASASADTFCVGSPPGCTGTTEPATSAGFQAALDAADANSSENTVQLPAGEFDTAGGFSYFGDNNSPVHIIGQGDTTVLKPTAAGITLLYLRLGNAPNSTVSGLKLDAYGGTESGYPKGLVQYDGVASHLTIEAETDPGGSSRGAQIIDGATLEDSSVNTSGIHTQAIQNYEGVSHFDRVTITGDGGQSDGSQGIGIWGDGTTIAHTKISGIDMPVYIQGGPVTVSDSLFDLGSLTNVRGVFSDPYSAPNTVDLNLRNVTIVGSGSGENAVTVLPESGASAQATIVDSLFALGAASYPVSCNAPGEATLTRVLHDSAADTLGACAVSDDHAFNYAATPPVFADAAAGDYRLASTSPGVDAGDPGFSGAGDADLAGNPRVAAATLATCPNGRVDIGAYEYTPSPPVVCPVATTTTGGGATSPTVSFGRFHGKFKFKSPRREKNGFAVTKKKPKGAELAVTSSAATTVRVTLATAKKKRLRGSQTLTLPAGRSYIVFRGKWNKKALKAGKCLATFAPVGGTGHVLRLTVG